MKVTIYDVAKKANVSPSTVSRVINNKSTVHDETRKIVLNAIEELGFVPDRFAQQMVNKKSRLIGVIVPHIGPSFYGKIIEGIEKSAADSGYRLFFCNTHDDPEFEEQYLDFFKQYWVDGIIIASNFQSVDKLIKLNIPFITVDHILQNVIPSYPIVSSDNLKGGKLAAEELVKNNRKNILLLRGPSFLMTTKERTKGAVEVFEKNKVNYIIRDFDILNPEIDEIERILLENKDIDGIFAYSDILAIVALNVLNKLNIDVPNKVSVVGFDNVLFSKWTSPSLTTIEQNPFILGQKAFTTLKDVMQNNIIKNDFGSVKLIKRNSTL